MHFFFTNYTIKKYYITYKEILENNKMKNGGAYEIICNKEGNLD